MSAPLPLAFRATDAPRERAYLLPGHIHAAGAPTEITTILGSCIAVCLWERRSGTGGVTHFVLPDDPGQGGSASHKFGATALPALIAALQDLGARPEDLQAKVFGGGMLFPAYPGTHIGERNTQLALRILGEQRIPILASDVGANFGRKLIFHSDSGDAWVKRIGE